MKQSGTIAFYSDKGDFLYSRRYNTIDRRTEAIELARKIYGRAFQRMFYQIAPDETLKHD